MSQRAVADISLEPVHDSHSGMHSQINLARVDKHREKLTLQQAPSTYTDVRTKTISVPITEVRSNRKNQKLTDYEILPSHRNRALTGLRSGFHLLRGTQHHHPVLDSARLDTLRLLNSPICVHQYYHLSATWSHNLRNFHLHQRRANTHGYAA